MCLCVGVCLCVYICMCDVCYICGEDIDPHTPKYVYMYELY